MRHSFILLFFLNSIRIIAQNQDAKRDYFWRSGFGIQTVQATTWDFNQRPTKLDWAFKKHGNHGEMGIICNTNGTLLLFRDVEKKNLPNRIKKPNLRSQ
jgi:hypothetical protein